MGLFVSAFELLNEVSMIEEAITCLFAAGRPSQGIDIAEQFLNDKLASEEASSVS